MQLQPKQSLVILLVAHFVVVAAACSTRSGGAPRQRSSSETVSDAASPLRVEAKASHDGADATLGLRDGSEDAGDGGQNAVPLERSSPCSSLRQTRIIGGVKTAAAALAVYARGTQVEVALGSEGVEIFDSRDQTSPVRLGLVDTPGEARGLAGVGHYLYVADGSAGLQIIDVEEPSSAEIVGAIDSPGDALEVRVERDLAAVADSRGGLHIIDVSNPSSPQLRSTISTPADLRGIRLIDGKVYAVEDAHGSQEGSFKVIDIGNPDAPQVVTTLVDVVTAKGSVALDVHKGRSYVSSRGSGINIYDVRIPSEPRHVGNLCYGLCDGVTTAALFTIGGRAIYGWGRKLVISDITVPGQERNIATFDVSEPIKGIAAHGKRIYLAMGDSGLKIARIEGPFPGVAGVTQIEERGRVIEVLGRNAVVGHGDVLEIIDVSSPWTMDTVGALKIGATVLSQVVVGHQVVVGTSHNDLRFVDLTDPRSPAEHHRVSVPSDANGLFSKGSLLFVAYGARRGGMAVIDLTVAPEMVANVLFETGASEVVASPERAFVLCGMESETKSLAIVDVTRPRHPRPMTHMELAGSPRGIAMFGHHILVGLDVPGELGSTYRLDVIDVHDGYHPRVRTSLELEYPLTSIQVIGRYAFCSSGGRGLVVIDVGRPEEPAVVAVVNHLGNREEIQLDAMDVAVSGRFVYLISSDELIAIELCGPPWRPHQLLTAPSIEPFISERYSSCS